MKLVASMNVKDEMDRYLQLTVSHLLTYCDEVRVQDDGSTDGGCEWLQEQDRVEVKRNEGPTWRDNEGELHQGLLDWTLDASPTHILAIDADELVPNGPKLRELMEAAEGVRTFTLNMQEVWDKSSDPWYVRVDGGWRPHPVGILYAVPTRVGRKALSHGEWRIWGRKMAGGRVPRVIRTDHHMGSGYDLDVDILHLGWSKPEEREGRHQRYVELDGGEFHASEHLDSIMYPDELVRLVPYPKPQLLIGPFDHPLFRDGAPPALEEVAA